MAGILSAGLGGNSLKGERKGILSGGSEHTKLEVRKRIGLFESWQETGVAERTKVLTSSSDWTL